MFYLSIGQLIGAFASVVFLLVLASILSVFLSFISIIIFSYLICQFLFKKTKAKSNLLFLAFYVFTTLLSIGLLYVLYHILIISPVYSVFIAFMFSAVLTYLFMKMFVKKLHYNLGRLKLVLISLFLNPFLIAAMLFTIFFVIIASFMQF